MSATTAEEPVAPAARRRTPREWLLDRDRRELVFWIGLLVLALVLRFWDLGARPFHHDESQDAYFSWTFANDFGSYQYDPLLHGPFRFFLTAGIYTLFGASDFTARLAPALMGVTVVGLPYLLRRQLGGLAAAAAGVLLCIGPSFLYFSRFAREDIYFAALSLGLIVAVWRYLDRPTRYGPSIIVVLVALMFATKETAFMSMAVAGAFFIPAAVVRRTGVRAAITAHGWRPWAWALVAFLVTWCVFFGVFFTQWGFSGAPRQFPITCADGSTTTVPLYSGVKGGFLDGIDYWLAQQCVARGAEKPWLYPAIILGDEWPTLLLGLVGVAWAVRRRRLMPLFLVWAVVGQLALYMWAAERFAWLVLHPLLPLVLLAGLGVQALWRASRTRGLQLAFGAVVLVALLGTGWSSVQANVRLEADPRELLVSTQSSPQVKQVVEEVRRMGPQTSITIDTADGATFPYAWYFRDDRVGYIDMTTANYQPKTDVLIMTQQSRAALAGKLGGYDGRRFDFRIWWVRDWKGARSVSSWFDYMVKRETWNPTGGLPEWLYVKR